MISPDLERIDASHSDFRLVDLDARGAAGCALKCDGIAAVGREPLAPGIDERDGVGHGAGGRFDGCLRAAADGCEERRKRPVGGSAPCGPKRALADLHAAVRAGLV